MLVCCGIQGVMYLIRGRGGPQGGGGSRAHGLPSGSPLEVVVAPFDCASR